MGLLMFSVYLLVLLCDGFFFGWKVFFACFLWSLYALGGDGKRGRVFLETRR